MNQLLTEENRDALQELMNVSMGQAANALAQLIQARITLSIPEIKIVTSDEFSDMLYDSQIWLTRQSFQGSVKGEVLTLLTKQGVELVAALLDYQIPLSAASQDAVILELANILAGACLRGFAAQLELTTKLSMPTSFKPVENNRAYHWTNTLLLKVEFSLSDTAFDSKIVICLDPSSVKILLVKLEQFLGS